MPYRRDSIRDGLTADQIRELLFPMPKLETRGTPRRAPLTRLAPLPTLRRPK